MASGRKFIQEGAIRRPEDALDRTLARHQRPVDNPLDDVAIDPEGIPLAPTENEQQRTEITDQPNNLLTSYQDNKFVNKLTNKQTDQSSNEQANLQPNKRAKKLMDPLVRVVLDKLALPYPEAESGKEPTVLVAGRVPQEVSDRLGLIVQHLAKKPKQQVLTDALKLYIAHMEQEGRRQ